jgi:hypothetical protein
MRIRDKRHVTAESRRQMWQVTCRMFEDLETHGILVEAVDADKLEYTPLVRWP